MLLAQSTSRSLFTFTSGMFGTLASHPYLLIDGPTRPERLSACVQPLQPFPPPSGRSKSPVPSYRYRKLNGTVRRSSPVGSPLCAPAAACSSRRSDTLAGPCRASVSCRRVRTETSRTGRGLGWTWWLLVRRTARFQHPAGTAAHMGVRCSLKTPSGKQPLSRLSCTLQVGLSSSLL